MVEPLARLAAVEHNREGLGAGGALDQLVLSTPYTLHPTPCTLHPTPYTLHPTPYTLHHALAHHTLRPTPYRVLV